MGKGVGKVGPWGDRPPRKPAVGAGRAALARRAKARGGGERKTAAEAARRGLGRDRGRRGARRVRGGRGAGGRAMHALGVPVKGAAAELGRWGRVFEQKFLLRQRLRTVLLALAAAWVVWTFLVGDAGLPRLWSVQRQNARLGVRIEDLAQEKNVLEVEVEALGGRRAGPEIERVAREEHAMVKDGEVLVRFREVPAADD